MRRWFALSGVLGSLVSGSAAADVAPGIDLSGPEAASVTSRWFTADALEARGHQRWAIGSNLVWSHKPLVVWDAASSDEELLVLVTHQVYFRPGVTWMLWDKLRLEAQIPVLLLNDADAGALGTTVYEPEQGVAFGDVRLAGDVILLGEPGDAVRAGAGLRLHVPTGSRSSYAGSGSVSLGPVAHLAGDVGLFAYASNLGFVRYFEAQRVGAERVSNQLAMNVAAGVRLVDKRLTVGPELSVQSALGNGDFFAEATTPVELMAGAHYQTQSGWLIGLGVGSGLVGAVGTPELRGQASLTWVPDPALEHADSDADGVTDDIDRCPTEAFAPGSEDSSRPGCPAPADKDADGVPDHSDECPAAAMGNIPDPVRIGCPAPADQDADGVPDDKDLCPEVAASAAADPARPGCPADRDADGVSDADDACPDEAPQAGLADPARPGCSLSQDRDGDGVRDADDACPDEPAGEGAGAAAPGCPAARVVGSEISISEQVPFATGTAELAPGSDDLLRAVAKVLADHPEITLLSIEGHTDSSGSSAYNLTLSARRAQAVRERLIALGVEPARLKDSGLGDSQPIAPNDDAAGRSKNRRVQFVIVERSAAPNRPVR